MSPRSINKCEKCVSCWKTHRHYLFLNSLRQCGHTWFLRNGGAGVLKRTVVRVNVGLVLLQRREDLKSLNCFMSFVAYFRIFKYEPCLLMFKLKCFNLLSVLPKMHLCILCFFNFSTHLSLHWMPFLREVPLSPGLAFPPRVVPLHHGSINYCIILFIIS